MDFHEQSKDSQPRCIQITMQSVQYKFECSYNFLSAGIAVAISLKPILLCKPLSIK